jgi:hypothetical protein
MATPGDRIKTPDQWTRTVAEHNTQSTVEEKEGQKFVILDYPAQFQGRKIIMDASRPGVNRTPTPPFRVEYILANPSLIFDDTSRLREDANHTGLMIADHFAKGWIKFSYKNTESDLQQKTARILWKTSDGEVQRLVLELNEADVTSAINLADKFISGVLDYICFSKEIPLDIHHIEVYEAATNELVRVFLSIPYKTQVQLNEQLLMGGIKTPKLLVPLLRLFREAINSTNAYYRMLCLYRIGEGLKGVRAENNQQVKEKDSVRKRPRQRIPENEFTKEHFSIWIGKPVDDFLTHVEHNFRKYVAHLIIDESFNWVPDPGTTMHAQETDKINGMLVSIVRQLIVDEWTFMQANGIA